VRLTVSHAGLCSAPRCSFAWNEHENKLEPTEVTFLLFFSSGRRHWFSTDIETTCPTSVLKLKIIFKKVFFFWRFFTEMKPQVKITRKQKKNMIDISSIPTRTESEPTVSLVGPSSSEKLLARRLRLSEFTCGKTKYSWRYLYYFQTRVWNTILSSV